MDTLPDSLRLTDGTLVHDDDGSEFARTIDASTECDVGCQVHFDHTWLPIIRIAGQNAAAAGYHPVGIQFLGGNLCTAEWIQMAPEQD